MEKELEEIKASMASRPNLSNQDIVSRSTSGETHSIEKVPISNTASPQGLIFQDPNWSFTTQSIDGIELQPVVIADLIQR